MNYLRLVFLFLFICFPIISFSQNEDSLDAQLKSNKHLYNSFQKFYKYTIRQETKDVWGKPYFFKIDRIYGLNYFDYNNDSKEDALIEFSITPSDSWSAYYMVAVLFENNNNNYEYIAHFYTGYKVFSKHVYPYLFFEGTGAKGTDINDKKKYVIQNNKFIEQ